MRPRDDLLGSTCGGEGTDVSSGAKGCCALAASGADSSAVGMEKPKQSVQTCKRGRPESGSALAQVGVGRGDGCVDVTMEEQQAPRIHSAKDHIPLAEADFDPCDASMGGSLEKKTRPVGPGRNEQKVAMDWSKMEIFRAEAITQFMEGTHHLHSHRYVMRV